MYRHQQYESRMKECFEDAPFFREAINLIDECTKLPKDDRITLRNQIKEYLRSIRDNRSPHNQEDTDHLQQLVQIFVEANRKKSLGKIHKGDRLMDWLQIKLRKLIDHSKKQKHRKQIQNFRKHKFIQVKKRPQKSIIHRHQERDPFQILGISRKTNEHSRMFNDQNQNSRKTSDHRYLIPSSLSRSRERSPIETSRKSSQSYAQYSYHKNFPFLKKTKDENQPDRDTHSQQQSKLRHLRFQKKITGLNRSVEHLSTYNVGNKASTSRSKYQLSNHREGSKSNFGSKSNRVNQSKVTKQTKKIQEPLKKESKNIVKEATKQEISYLTKQFTEQLNSVPQEPSKQQQQMFMSPTFNFTPIPQPPITTYNSYEQSSKKLQEMLQGSKSILEQLNSSSQLNVPQNYQYQFPSSNEKEMKYDWTEREETKKEKDDITSNEKKKVEDIFTPPDFLAECRKMITSSQKKVQQNLKDFSGSKEESGTKLTFNNILSDSRQKKEFVLDHNITSTFGQMTFNEVVSENPSANISSKKPESEVQFQLKNTSIFSTSQLLLELFKNGPSVLLDRYQLGHIMSQCDQTTEKILQDYCSILDKDQNNVVLEFKFVAMVKFCFSCGKNLEETQFSSFLCSILDMKKNGYVSGDDVSDFLESMQGSGVEQQMLDEITSLLNSVFGRCCEIERAGSMMTRWSLSYLQLIKDDELSSLNELLSRFQFQIDSQQ